MKTRFFLYGLMVLAGVALAQEPDALQTELDRIQAERVRQEANFAQQEAACYQRFAVNDCLRRVKAARRPVMEDLRRQEVAIQDERRRLRGIEQLQRLEEKASSEVQQEAADKREEALRAHQERLERAEQKQAEKLQAEQDRLAAPPRGERDKSSDRPTAESRSADRLEFEEKQRQAVENRARRDKALADKAAKPPVRSLPTPP
jgi:hypothetical protein